MTFRAAIPIGGIAGSLQTPLGKYRYGRASPVINSPETKMKYIEIESGGKSYRLPASYPHLLELTIDPADWHRLNQQAYDNPAFRILSHDVPADGWMTVRVACASEAVVDQLEDAW
jgi:hypothetical protein